MKTYEQLMQHYWGVIVPMAEAAGINSWECVKYRGEKTCGHPNFTLHRHLYTFAVAALEGKPVFVGDKLWLKGGHQITVEDNLYINTGVMTWTPPAKRTFEINGHEVPEPMREKPEKGTEYWYIDPCEYDLCDWSTWENDSIDNNRLKNGVCHLTRENCIIHAKALFSFSEVGG